MFNNLMAHQGGYPNPVVAGDFRKMLTPPTWLDNSGTTGNRMVTDSTGTLTWAPANMLLRSEDFSATWSLTNTTQTAGQSDPNGATSATTLSASAANGTVKQGVTTLARTYIFSIWLKRKTGTGNIDITADGTTWVTQSITSSWVRYSVSQTGVVGTSNPGIRISTSGDEVYAFGAQLEPVTYQTAPRDYIPTTSAAIYQPRFDYDPSTTPATPRGLLIEESRTNLVTYSEQFDNTAWSKTATTVTANSVASPDGQQTADKIVETTALNSHSVGEAYSLTSGTTYTGTVYLKAAERAYAFLAMNGGFSVAVVAAVNLTTGSVSIGTGASLILSVSAKNAGNGWWRVSMTATADTTATGSLLVYVSKDGVWANRSYTGEAASGIYVWGAQFETGAFATSYIPASFTTSATRVMLAEVVGM